MVNRTLGCARFVYNHFLRVRMDAWNANKHSVQYIETASMLKDLKKYPEYSWLKEVDSTALQQSLRDLQKSYDNFFAKRAGYPHFKSKHNCCLSYRSQCVNNNIRVVGDRIQLPKIGRVKIKLSREVVGKISSATITRTASSKYYVSLCVTYETDVLPNAGAQLGIDVGLKEFYSDSNTNWNQYVSLSFNCIECKTDCIHVKVTNEGWSTENQIYGGRFKAGENGVNVEHPGMDFTNGWKFYNCGIEGGKRLR